MSKYRIHWLIILKVYLFQGCVSSNGYHLRKRQRLHSTISPAGTIQETLENTADEPLSYSCVNCRSTFKSQGDLNYHTQRCQDLGFTKLVSKLSSFGYESPGISISDVIVETKMSPQNEQAIARALPENTAQKLGDEVWGQSDKNNQTRIKWAEQDQVRGSDRSLPNVLTTHLMSNCSTAELGESNSTKLLPANDEQACKEAKRNRTLMESQMNNKMLLDEMKLMDRDTISSVNTNVLTAHSKGIKKECDSVRDPAKGWEYLSLKVPSNRDSVDQGCSTEKKIDDKISQAPGATVEQPLKAIKHEVVEEHPDKSATYICPECDENVNSDIEFIKHVKQHHENNKMALHSNYQLSSQEESTLDIEPRECEGPFECHQRASIVKEDLNRHSKILVKKELKPFQCSHCPYTSMKKSDLTRHEKKQCKPFKCSLCSYSATKKIMLQSHERTHAGEKTFKCPNCSYAAVHKYSLVVHMKSKHMEEKPFKCNQCSYASVVKTDIDRHCKTHVKNSFTSEKVRRYERNQGSYKRLRKSDRILLQRKHSAEKPFKCSLCPYAAIKKKMLESHRRTHAGEKTFKCPNCSYAAVHKNSLVVHMKSKHMEEKPFKCDQCSYASVVKTDIDRHCRTHALSRQV